MKNPFRVTVKNSDETADARFIQRFEKETPGDILDRFVNTLRTERDAHLAAIETLEQDIEYKTACLRNHRKAFEACNTALLPLCNEPEKPLKMEKGVLKMNVPSTLQTAMRNVDDFSAMEQELEKELELNVRTNGKGAPEANRNSGTTSRRTDESR